MVLLITGCQLLDSVRSPENERRAEELLTLKDKVEKAIENKDIGVKEGIAIIREIDDLKKDVSGNGNILFTLLGTLGNVGLLLLRHKIPGIKST